MGKKIFSVGMVKNNVELIESHVRYNLNVFDGMIILDNGSTDGTFDVLNQLVHEELPLIVIEDSDREYEQAVKINQLILKAINDFDADIIVPLDSDEFLTSENQGNPRKILEKIEPNSYHLVKWKTYVPDLSMNKNEKFIPAKITMARDDVFEEYYKVIIPKEIVIDYNVQVTFGNHNITNRVQYDGIIKRVMNPNIRVAHFPVVSKEQIISKAVIAWIYNCYRPGKKDENLHFKVMFDKLKKKVDLDDEDVMNFAMEYAIIDDHSEIKVQEDPMDLSFCYDIKMMYTPNEVNPFSNILESCEWLAMDAANFKKESIVKQQKLESKIEKLSMEMDEQHRKMINTQKTFKELIQVYESSNSWKMTAPLRKVSNMINKDK